MSEPAKNQEQVDVEFECPCCHTKFKGSESRCYQYSPKFRSAALCPNPKCAGSICWNPERPQTAKKEEQHGNG